jgi:hypothetical protein
MSALWNSSRGFVFMEMLWVFFALVWILTVFFRRYCGQGRPYIDVLPPIGGSIGPVGPVGPMGVVVAPPTYGLPPATSVVLGSSANIGNFQIMQCKLKSEGQSVEYLEQDISLICST